MLNVTTKVSFEVATRALIKPNGLNVVIAKARCNDGECAESLETNRVASVTTFDR